MIQASRTPSPLLAPFVSKLWYFEGGASHSGCDRRLPTTSTQIVLNLHADSLRWWEGPSLDRERRARGAVVSGLYDHAFAIDAAEQQRVVGAVLPAGALPALFRVDADEFAHRHLELDLLWGRCAAQLRERLLEAPTPQATLAAFEAFLLTRLRGGLEPALVFARDALERGSSVASVARELAYSGKRLRQLFVDFAGITPKRYARVARLQQLLASLEHSGARSWAQLAAACGYYDQAHLIGEFRALTGLTPSAYRPRFEGALNHVPLDR